MKAINIDAIKNNERSERTRRVMVAPQINGFNSAQ